MQHNRAIQFPRGFLEIRGREVLVLAKSVGRTRTSQEVLPPRRDEIHSPWQSAGTESSGFAATSENAYRQPSLLTRSRCESVISCLSRRVLSERGSIRASRYRGEIGRFVSWLPLYLGEVAMTRSAAELAGRRTDYACAGACEGTPTAEVGQRYIETLHRDRSGRALRRASRSACRFEDGPRSPMETEPTSRCVHPCMTPIASLRPAAEGGPP